MVNMVKMHTVDNTMYVEICPSAHKGFYLYKQNNISYVHVYLFTDL